MKRPYGMSGDLEAMSLADIVQTLSLGARTARVGVDAGSRRGELWLRHGALTHAQTGALSGETAVFEMLGWQEGQFVIEYDVLTEARSIEQESTYLVLEGLRRLDERGTVSPDGDEAPESPPRPTRAAVRDRDQARWLWTAIVGLAAGVAVIVLAASGLLPWTIPDTAAMVEGAPGDHLDDAADARTSPESQRLSSKATARGETARPAAPADDRAAPPPGEADRSTTAAKEPGAPPAGLVDLEDPSIEPIAIAPPVPAELAPGLLADAAPAAVTGPDEPVPPATLHIEGKCKVDDGAITVLVDGAEVWSRAFGSRATDGEVDDRFDVDVTVLPGPREIATRVDIGEERAIHESRLRAEFGEDSERTLKIVAGKRFGRPVSVKLD